MNMIRFLLTSPLVQVPALAFGWTRYFFHQPNGGAFLWVLIAYTVFSFLTIRSGLKKAAAAGNVVAAAATFATLAGPQQATVHAHAIEIIRRSSFKTTLEPRFHSDADRYGWYALSMMELGIAPLPIIPGWQVVRNPWIAVGIKDSQIDTALELAKRKGFDVSISRDYDLSGPV
jgi:hypothetical protein